MRGRAAPAPLDPMPWRSTSAGALRLALCFLFAAGGCVWAWSSVGGSLFLVGVLLFGATAAIHLWEGFSDRFHEKVLPERQWVVRVDGGRVHLRTPEGEESSCRLDELDLVTVETNDSGPWGIDFWILLGSAGGELGIPLGATGEDELLDRLKGLAGFDGERWGRAVRSTECERFVCWERPRPG